MAWTIEQQRAIADCGNLLISAAAGSGKTAVLTERIARLINEGADIDELLVVTFTRAAAAEMKKRIAARLTELAADEPDADAASRLNRAAADIGRASISTIDAFCAHVLRRHFSEAGLDPAFRAADEAEAEVLKQDALDELLESRYALEGFGALVDAFGGEEPFCEAALRLYSFICAQPSPIGWLKTAINCYDTDEEGLASSPLMAQYIASSKSALRARMDALICRRDAIAADFPDTAAILDDDLSQAGALFLQNGYAGYAARLAAIEFRRFAMRGALDDVKQPVMRARDALKDLVKAQQREYARPLAFHVGRLGALLPHLNELCSFMEDFISAYSEKKREAGVIDYGDMEHLALELLCREDIAREYKSRFRYVFVDEYQDCNPVQDSIFNAIRREDNLFLVGDVKQSIYRFRMAEPSLFTDKMQAFDGGAGGCIRLSANFRSSAAVISAVNTVFSSIMTKDAGGVDYSAGEGLVMGRQNAPGAAELHLLPCRMMTDPEDVDFLDEDAAQQIVSAEAEAMFAAERIRGIVGQSFTDRSGVVREYRYSDIVILHSSPKRIAEAWVQTLAREGVPAYADMTGGYFEAVEVQIFLNLLRLIDNPLQDIPLLSVLRSPIGGFDTEELILLRAGRREDTCFASLKAAAQNADPLGIKAGAFLSRLAVWRRDVSLYELTELIGMLLDDTGFETYVAALPGGAARKANLEALIQSAASYAHTGRGLNGFLRFMDRVKDTGRMGSAQIASANVVRLISIHKSKGLEFPVVFLAGLSKQFNDADKKAHLALDARLGIGLRPVYKNTRLGNVYHAAIASRAWLMNVAEQMRVLYVGMTRASERLIMLASFNKDMAAELQKRALPLSPAYCASAMHFTDWLLPALMQTPSGNPMRRMIGLPELPGEACVSVCIHTGVSALASGAALSKTAFEAFAANARESGPGGTAARFAWQYPYLEDTTVPSKLSVSEFLGNLPELPEYPAFLREKVGLKAAGRGTAAHLLMERISLAPHTAQSVERELSQLTASGVMSEAEASAVYIPSIVGFFASPLGQRLLASPRVERELPFNHRVSARVLTGAPTDETVLLQGVIDCCFTENGSWVLLDYKTDFVPEGRAQQTALRHRPQLLLYKNALEALSGMPVSEMHIRLLSTGQSVQIPF